MTVYQVYGDLTPYMCIHIREPELKQVATRLALGIKPEDIRLTNRPFDGSRNLGVIEEILLNGKGYVATSKGNYVSLIELKYLNM